MIKRYKSIMTMAVAAIITTSCNQSVSDKKAAMENVQANAIFPKGEIAPQENFTGIAWVNRIVKQDVSGAYSVGNVLFEAGARTNWHTHPGGQTLIVTDGAGWYQEKGKPARSLHKGDVVLIPSNAIHWHGAANNNSLTHIAITNLKDGNVKWLQAVNEKEYNSIKKLIQ